MLRRVWRRFEAWFLRVVYMPYLYTLHLRHWPKIARVRRLLRMKGRVVPCCRHNLGWPAPFENRSDMQVRVCSVCKRRHIELRVDSTALGIVSTE